MAVLAGTEQDDVIAESKLREHLFVGPRSEIRDGRVQDEGVGVFRRNLAFPRQRDDEMILEQLEVAVGMIDGDQSLVDDDLLLFD